MILQSPALDACVPFGEVSLLFEYSPDVMTFVPNEKWFGVFAEGRQFDGDTEHILHEYFGFSLIAARGAVPSLFVAVYKSRLPIETVIPDPVP